MLDLHGRPKLKHSSHLKRCIFLTTTSGDQIKPCFGLQIFSFMDVTLEMVTHWSIPPCSDGSYTFHPLKYLKKSLVFIQNRLFQLKLSILKYNIHMRLMQAPGRELLDSPTHSRGRKHPRYLDVPLDLTSI